MAVIPYLRPTLQVNGLKGSQAVWVARTGELRGLFGFLAEPMRP
jgi:hypothetical protein